MKIIDSNNTPEEVLILLKHDDYDYEAAKDTLTATTFNKSVQEIVLIERHYDEIEIEASDCLWRVLGSAVHKLLEDALNKAKLPEFVQTEERLYGEILGQQISSRFDLVRNNYMCDYKVTSAWTRVFGSRDKEWVRQESINRYLYNKVYKRVLNDKSKLIVLYRDWSAKNVGGKYPERPFESIELDLMSIEETEMFLEGKVRDIKEARELKDSSLPKCTDEERWKGYDKKLRKDVFRKCEKYCNAYKFCSQAKELA